MALNAYLILTGKKTGSVKGSSIQKGREGWIVIMAADHNLNVPFDAASGQATGKRRHGALKVTKEIDKSSPVLFNMLVTNENITSAELRFFVPNTLGVKGGAGTEVNAYTIKLTNARLVGIHTSMLNNRMTEHQTMPLMEDVSLVYETIEWTWHDGGITAMDSFV